MDHNIGSSRKPGTGMNYTKFALTMFISFLVMYAVMFLNMENLGHYHTSASRIYMTLLMISPMGILMMLMMRKMYPNKNWNALIIVGSILLFAITLTALRTQTPIGDEQYMKAMIPHHSSAIMVSKNATLTDPELIKLSKEIIIAQEKEIAQMESILRRLK